MTIKQEIKKLNLTGMEEECLQSLIEGLYAESGFSDVDASDIAESTGIDIKSVRGVLASLVKKGFIEIDDNGAGYQIIYLRPEHYNLHSQRWVDEYRDMFPWRFESTETVSEHYNLHSETRVDEYQSFRQSMMTPPFPYEAPEIYINIKSVSEH